MKTVFIFGAGASREAGGPLMSDFLDVADILKRQRHSVSDAIKKFDDVFDAISELQGVFSKSYLDLDNIESLFGAIEMGLLLEKFAERKEDDIKSLRISLITLIYKTLENSIVFPARNRKVFPPIPYETFVDELIKLFADSKCILKESDISFITFNYDLCLDYALNFYSLLLNYGLNPDDIKNTLLLKLHGSINWGVCDICEKVILNHVKDVRFPYLDDSDKVVRLDLGSTLNRKSCCNKRISGEPLIVPPTWNKTEYHGHDQIVSVWRHAARCLGAAENIFVIGYSLPETDSFFRYLFALGSESKTRIKNFWVINPDSKGQVENRFKDIIGRNIEGRFKFIRKKFSKSIPEIIQTLKNS